MTTINETIINYIAAWNETDPSLRRALIARAWSAGYRFRLSSGIEAHHDQVRFSWTAGGAPDAPLFFAGTDFAKLAPDGRFQAVTGFTDAMPVLG